MSSPTQAGASRQREGGGAPPSRRRFRSDDIVALVLLAFAAVVFLLTTTFEKVPSSLSLNMPPEFFPRLIVWTIVALTAAMVIENRYKPEKVRKPVPRMVFYTTGLLFGFLVLAELIGITLTMVVFCGLLPLLWGERRYWLVGIYLVVFPTLVYLLFAKVLEVRFPTGAVFRWAGYFINL